jgi:hypothetical protein
VLAVLAVLLQGVKTAQLDQILFLVLSHQMAVVAVALTQALMDQMVVLVAVEAQMLALAARETALAQVQHRGQMVEMAQFTTQVVVVVVVVGVLPLVERVLLLAQVAVLVLAVQEH